jgi:ubiquinone/menaquinone biosynthesis C-methylase UbiE
VEEAKRRAQETYNAASDHFDDPALAFWDRFGRGTIDRLDLGGGATVLDVCAGAGASALAAARRVAPEGRVLAVDLADDLLALAREKAETVGLESVLETRCADLESLDEGLTFDAVVIVFGLFFLPDMVAAASHLWRLVSPGGQLAVTTWGPRLFEPADGLFWKAVRAVRSELERAYNPWDSLTNPQALRDVLDRAGVPTPRIEAEAAHQPLRSPEDFWAIVLGSGYRATHDALSPAERKTVHDRVVAELESTGIDRVETNVIYAVARKPHLAGAP